MRMKNRLGDKNLRRPVLGRSMRADADHESDLKSLHEISFELSLCQDANEVCREAVRFGRERLGFDRLAIWLVDQEDPRWKLGTWGIDGEGALCDERGLRQRRTMKDLPSAFYEGGAPLSFEEMAALCDFPGRGSGRANKLLAPLWDGRALIGEICADDLLRHEGFRPEKREAFVIFARIIAHLVSLKRAEAELKCLASTDSLTGAVNRRTALIILEKHIAQSRRSGAPLALCLADLDGLKLVNDAYGHAAGDDYIRSACSRLVGAVRESDTVGRIGGDEFLVIFPDCRGDVVASIMERVNEDLAAGARAGAARDEGFLPRLSWGIAFLHEVANGSGVDGLGLQACIDLLLELADQRMYDDKRNKGSSRSRASGAAEMAS
jgi:diguanylate cyclase (GGDEF)-like protein